MKILIVEDEKELNRMLADYLENLGYSVICRYDGREIIEVLDNENPQLVILDIMLPGMDGLDLLRRIRKQSDVLVIMLTAKSTEQDVLIGLELGADDYIKKPFSMKELAARIRTLARRNFLQKENRQTEYADFSIDEEKRTIRKNGQALHLTTVQFDILLMMMKSPGRVFSRMQLLHAFQDAVYEGYERTIDVHIKNIRKIIGSQNGVPYIETVRGIGYKLNEDAGNAQE
ncbi:MAG: response regulator transcription factor [Spirochaetales bacterium]|nr:response regulator transcription factor [Spirochaetales bacterium]